MALSGAYLDDGLTSPLLLELADELTRAFPRVFTEPPPSPPSPPAADGRAALSPPSGGGADGGADGLRAPAAAPAEGDTCVEGAPPRAPAAAWPSSGGGRPLRLTQLWFYKAHEQ